MDGDRLARGLGWMSVGFGLTQLTFTDPLCRLLAIPGRAGLLRSLGLREVATGLGLLTGRNGRPWLWGRVAGDVLDLALLGATLRRPWRAAAWRIAATVAVASTTLVDLYAARRVRARPGVQLDDLLDAVHAPGESWRGSGLAEDVGLRQQRGADAEADEAQRQRRMKDAQEQLGLPDPDTRGMH